MNTILEHRAIHGGEVIRHTIVDTAWGQAGIIGQGDLLLRVYLPEVDEQTVVFKMKSQYSDSIRDINLLPNAQQALRDYYLGKQSSQPIPVSAAWAGVFGQSVLKELIKIQPGQTVTYGRLSSLAGRERAARAVGSIMRRNPTPLLIPCHRVIRGDGRLGGFSGQGGTDVKKRLLDHERNMITSQRTVTQANQEFSFV